MAAGEVGEEFSPTGAPPSALLTAEDAEGQREQEVMAFRWVFAVGLLNLMFYL